MIKNFTVISDEWVQNFETIPGLEKASSETINFIHYVQESHPELTLSQAGYVAAYFIHNLPRLIEANPDIKTALRKTADYIKTNEIL